MKLQSDWDIVVVGAGPAGSLAACLLARQRLRVLLVDKAQFPRWKVCGCCLSARALSLLRSEGLGTIADHPAASPLRDILWAAPQRQALLNLPGWTSLSREDFDVALIEAATNAGAVFQPGTQATLGPIAGDRRQLLFRQGDQRHEVHARLVLAADGLAGSLLAREAPATIREDARMGAGAVAFQVPGHFQPGRIYMASGPQGYLGMVRLDDGRMNLAAALDRGWVRTLGSPGRAAESLIEAMGWPRIDDVANVPWRGTPLLTRQAQTLGAQRVLTLGDAAGFVEPFTGEGMTWALVAARDIVPIALQACRHWQPSTLHTWKRTYRASVGNRQLPCRVFAWCLRRPPLIRAALAVLAHVPQLAQPVVSYLNQSP